jgi:hypothetical protein
MSASKLRNEAYDHVKMEALYYNIVARSKTDKPQFYEIKVDDFTVIEKTNDPERFMDFSEYVTPTTKHITVLLYQPNSTTSDKLFFHLQKNAFSDSIELKGTPSPVVPLESEAEKKEKWRKETHYEELLEENEELKEEIAGLENTIEAIEEEKERIKNYRDLDISSTAGLALNAVRGFLKGVLPSSSDLSGASQETAHPTDTNNSFKRKSAQNKEEVDVESEMMKEPVMSEEEKKFTGFINDIKERVGDAELLSVIHLLDMVTKHPKVINFAVKQVHNYIKQQPNYKPEKEATDYFQEEDKF